MALSQSSSLSSLIAPFRQLHIVGESRGPRSHLISSFHTARIKPCFPLRINSCVAEANSEDRTRETPSISTSISSVFVKGLPDSVNEGRLRKVFSDFGQVSNVKIIINERTRKSLGYGYVWFNSKEDAELAVEAMNGKFFDGRFILVKLGQPGLSTRRRSHSNSLFVNK